MRQWKVKNTNRETLTSDYYIVFINPDEHKKPWNALKLLLHIAEAKYVVYHDYEIDFMELHPVDEEEFYDYNYCPN